MADSARKATFPETLKEKDVRLSRDVKERIHEILEATHSIDNLKTIDLGPKDELAWKITYTT